MPRIAAPAAAAVLQRPREFALLQLLSPAADGSVPESAFQSLLEQYGKAKVAEQELSFEDFAALFQKPPTTSDWGEGNTIGYAAPDATGPLKPWRFDRRATQPNDVRVQIAYVGICRSDIHTARNEWKNANYPVVPGHEIAGFVTEVGSEVTRFKVGDRVGVGVMVNSCQSCYECTELKEEQYCGKKGTIGTYNVKDHDGSWTYGGYSTQVVVNQKFVLRIPEKLLLADAAPLLCAGITVYSPIRKFGFDKPGMHVGVVGLGGLGHMAVKFLKALGVTATIISTSIGKKEEALGVLGADHFLVSKDEEQLKAAAGTLDGIIDTVSVQHDLGQLMSLLKLNGTHVCLGIPEQPTTAPISNLVFRRQRLTGSLIGGVAETQEMLDFCADNGVACMCEHIKIEDVNKAYDRVVAADVRYRFVIDILDSLV